MLTGTLESHVHSSMLLAGLLISSRIRICCFQYAADNVHPELGWFRWADWVDWLECLEKDGEKGQGPELYCTRTVHALDGFYRIVPLKQEHWSGYPHTLCNCSIRLHDSGNVPGDAHPELFRLNRRRVFWIE